MPIEVIISEIDGTVISVFLVLTDYESHNQSSVVLANEVKDYLENRFEIEER